MKHWRGDNDFTVRQSFSITGKLASVQKSTIISIKATTTGTERTVCREKIQSFTYVCLDAYFPMFSRVQSTGLDGLLSFLSNVFLSD